MDAYSYFLQQPVLESLADRHPELRSRPDFRKGKHCGVPDEAGELSQGFWGSPGNKESPDKLQETPEATQEKERGALAVCECH